MLFRPKIQYPTPETINRKCTGRKILSTVLHDVLCIRISVQMHIMHFQHDKRIAGAVHLFHGLGEASHFFGTNEKVPSMRTLSHSIAILQLRSEADEAILKRPHSNWMRALHESTGLPVQERGTAVWRDIDTTYPAYLTGSALNRPSRRAAVYHASLMQCAYTRNSAQCERAAGGPRPSRPQAAQTARAAACADRARSHGQRPRRTGYRFLCRRIKWPSLPLLLMMMKLACAASLCVAKQALGRVSSPLRVMSRCPASGQLVERDSRRVSSPGQVGVRRPCELALALAVARRTQHRDGGLVIQRRLAKIHGGARPVAQRRRRSQRHSTSRAVCAAGPPPWSREARGPAGGTQSRSALLLVAC